MDIHLIPGLGTDHRIFDRLLVHVPDRHAHDWPVMAPGSSLRHFAEALAERIDASRPHVLIGMSMGGMVVQEMSAITKPQRVVIISSWKGPHEMPLPIRSLRGTHPERVLTKEMLKRLMPMIRWQMGVRGKEELDLLDAFMHANTIEQLKVQVAAVLGWYGPSTPVEDQLHIHGDQDRLMPLAPIKNVVVVPGGTHFMVFSKAGKVEAIILAELAGSK
jgi:pimeloyl-ACP methyl ester carboxylesterase